MTDNHPPEPSAADQRIDPRTGLPQARSRRTRWPGWVWLIPLVALGFATWLAINEWVLGPHPLAVHFASVEGIKPGAPVRYKGVQVGSVDTITLDDDLAGATLVLDMNGLDGRLGDGTRIWIQRPSLSPGQIGNLISGPYLAIAPGGQGEVDELQGLDEAPILPPDGPGRSFVLTVDDGEGIDAGAPVRFRGMKVGRVLGKRFGEDGGVELPVFIDGDHAQLVHEATVFWRAGGLAVDKGAGGLDIDFPSFASLATGAVAFDTPAVLAGAQAEADARFALWDSRKDAATAQTGPRLAYMLVFPDPVGDLGQGAPVTLAGKQIGRVAGTTLEVAPDGSGLITPVTIVLDARQLGIDDLASLDTREALRARVDAIVGKLVSIGMRAKVAEGGIVFGARSIELVIDRSTPPGSFDPGQDPPVIPTAGGKGGSGGVASGAAASGAAASGGTGSGAAGSGARRPAMRPGAVRRPKAAPPRRPSAGTAAERCGPGREWRARRSRRRLRGHDSAATLAAASIRGSTMPDDLPLSAVPVALDRDRFLRNLLRELSGTLESVVGIDEASGYISVVGGAVGEQIDSDYRAALNVEQADARPGRPDAGRPQAPHRGRLLHHRGDRGPHRAGQPRLPVRRLRRRPAVALHDDLERLRLDHRAQPRLCARADRRGDRPRRPRLPRRRPPEAGRCARAGLSRVFRSRSMNRSGLAQGVIDALPEPAFLLTREGGIIGANRAARGMLGDGTPGDNLADRLLTPRDEVESYLARCRATTTPMPGALTFRMTDGEMRFRVNCARLSGRSDEVVLLLRCADQRGGRFSILAERVRQLDAELRRRVREKAVLREALDENRNLMRELQHRVKNNIQMMISLLSMSAANGGTPEVQIFVNGAKDRFRALATTQDLIYEAQSASVIPARELFGRLARALADSTEGAVAISTDIADIQLPQESAHCLALIVNELVTNSIKHGMSDGTGSIRIALDREDGQIRLVVRDDGPGYPALELVAALLGPDAGARALPADRRGAGAGRQRENGGGPGTAATWAGRAALSPLPKPGRVDPPLPTRGDRTGPPALRPRLEGSNSIASLTRDDGRRTAEAS